MAVSLTACLSASTHRIESEVVKTYRDSSGWKLQVGNRDHFIKGVVWSYTPRGENHSFDLWSEPDDLVRRVLDYEFSLMRAAGINTVRSFSLIPPRWIAYIYSEFGIMSVVNPLMGRYGYEVDGTWTEVTDYSDRRTRESLTRDMLEIVRSYKDTPGVLMFAFGNESNYGLSWSSFEIENLPVGEQDEHKARYMYSLFNDVIKAAKSINPDHPYTIVNGDLQYLDLIVELCPDLDLLGTNVYRGAGFTSMWEEVDEKLGLGIALFEFGSDAYNARLEKEDQVAQARLLTSQWREIYQQSYGNGSNGNSLGGFIFEWRDEWWKYLQNENLDVQDRTASWSNQAYEFDWSKGANNMNEEWFGIVSLGEANANGVATATPRLAYDILARLLQVDPYTNVAAETNRLFDAAQADLETR